MKTLHTWIKIWKLSRQCQYIKSLRDFVEYTGQPYDSPWKEALERFFPQCLEFFFPTIHEQIDWTQGWEFLDKEFQQIMRDAEVGRRLVDKLVKVWRLDGQETWVLIHLEIQGQVESEFSERMFTYFYSIRDRYRQSVVSLGILTDETLSWRPSEYILEIWGYLPAVHAGIQLFAGVPESVQTLRCSHPA